MKLVVGLGNPGREYEGTRHNVGFDVVDLLAKDSGIEVTKRRFEALIGEGVVSGERVMLIKPQTFMNNSGQAVRQTLDWCKLPASALLVVCDDANLPLGRLRFRREGSCGGHNGLESIIAHVGTEAFARLRLGIDRDRGGLVDHVLGRFSPAERKVMNEAYIDATRGVVLWMSGGIDKCMNEFNG